MGSETLPSACYLLFDESSIPFYSTSNGYKYKKMLVINGKYRIHFSSFFSSMKNLGATFLGGLWAQEWAWHVNVTNLRCVGISTL